MRFHLPKHIQNATLFVSVLVALLCPLLQFIVSSLLHTAESVVLLCFCFSTRCVNALLRDSSTIKFLHSFKSVNFRMARLVFSRRSAHFQAIFLCFLSTAAMYACHLCRASPLLCSYLRSCSYDVHCSPLESCRSRENVMQNVK